MPEPDYEVPNEQIKVILNAMAKVIDEHLPDGWGFALLVFNYEPAVSEEEPRALFYISNAERGTMLKSMQEFIRSNKERGH